MTLNLRFLDKTEKESPPISGIVTRSRFIIFILRLGLRDENENSKSCHLSLYSRLKGLTILHAISGRLTISSEGLYILHDVLPF